MLTKDLREYYDYIKILKKMQKIDSLEAIRNYACFAIKEINKPIDTNKVEINSNEIKKQVIFQALFWLENLTRDILAYWWTYFSSESLCKRKNLTRARNEFNNLEWRITQEITEIFGNDKIIHVLFLLWQDQFTHQEQNAYHLFCRYYRLYSETELSKYINEKLWISVDALYILWLTYFGMFSKNFIVNTKSNFNWISIKNEDNKKFLDLFSLDIDIQSQRIKSIQESAEITDILYSWKRCLIDAPIYDIWNKQAVCPLPHFLMQRLTTWISYFFTWSWVHDWKFWDLLWLSFEKFIGKIIYESNLSQRDVIEWEKWTKTRDADRFIKEKNTLITIECKARELTKTTKTLVSQTKSFENDIWIIADALIQSFESINKENINKKFWKKIIFDEYFNLVILLEDTLLRIIDSINKDHFLKESLNQAIEKKLALKSIKKNDYEKINYLVLSVNEFELLTFLAKTHWFGSLIREKKTKYPWLFWIKWYLEEQYKNEFPKGKPFYIEKVIELMNQAI